MKIGIYSPYLATLGGGEKYILTLASCLSWDHEVILFWDKSGDEIKKRAKDRFNLNLSSVEFEKNIFEKNVSFIERLKISNRYDAILCLSDGSIPFVFCKKLFIHFQFPVEWVNVNVMTKIKLSRVTKIICNSYFTKQYIDKKFAINSKVIYPPVTMIKRKAAKENLILTIGRLSELTSGDTFKKHELLIRVFKERIKNKMKGWKFVIVVSYNEESKYIVEKLKNDCEDTTISIIENPTFEVVENLYEKAKIYWHAAGFNEDLKMHPEYAEHFGISTAESMSAGAVPVVFDAGGQKEIVTNGKDGYLWNTEEELVEKTVKLQNEAFFIKLSNQAIKKSALFSEEKFCEEVKKLFV